MSQNEETHQTIPFPANRQHVLETLQTWERKHTIHGLLEVDVTQARQFIQEYAALTGETLSFTGFIISCVGRAVEENKTVHALRNWRNELVLFDEVDLATVVEVTQGNQRFPISHIIRSVNGKTFKRIHEEIREVQSRASEQARSRRTKSRRLFWMVPGFTRRLFYRIASRSPGWMKRNVGTVALTAIGMFGEGGGWGIPIAVTPLFITLGGIAQKPGVTNGQIEIREYLSLTVTFDHDVVDGAPAARFTARLKELIETGPSPFDQDGASERI